MVAANVKAVLVLIAIAFDACLEVVAAWWGNGSISSQVDTGGWSDGRIGRYIDWEASCSEGESRR